MSEDMTMDTGVESAESTAAPAESAPVQAEPVSAAPQQAQAQTAQTQADTNWYLSTDDFKGQDISPEFIDHYSRIAKDVGVNKDQAIGLLSKAAKLALQLDIAIVNKQAQEWINQVKNDPEIGGANYDQSMLFAQRAIKRFGTPGLRDSLNRTGYGNDPDLVRTFVRIGKTVSEDDIITGGSGKTTATTFDEAARKLFG